MERSFRFLGFCLILSLQVCQNVATTIEMDVLQARLELMDKTITDLVKKDIQQQAINKKQTDINQQLQTTIDDLQDVITRLREDNRNHDNTISQLTESLSQQQTTISKMKKKIHYQNFLIKIQLGRTRSLERQYHLPKMSSSRRNPQAKIIPSTKSDVGSDFDHINEASSSKKTKVREKKKKMEQAKSQKQPIMATNLTEGQQKRLVLANESPVAFMASISTDIIHLGNEQNIHFDTVQLNLGNGYHNLHGVFIVPKSGIYIFSANVVFYDVDKIDAYAAIVKNGNVIATLYSHGDDHSWDQSSQTIIVQVNQGDEIWVRTLARLNTSVSGNHNDSTFSGYLLFPL